MFLERIVLSARQFVGPTEADEVRCDDAQAPGGEHGDHPAENERPAALAMQQQHDPSIARALVDKVHAQLAEVLIRNFGIVRGEAEFGEVREVLFGGTNDAGHALVPHALP